MPSLPPPRSIIQRSAENGLLIGAFLTALAVFTGLGTTSGIFGFLVWAGSIFLLFFVYALLRRSYAENSFQLGLPELWAETLAMFFFGAAIQAVVIYLLLRFVAPGFVGEQLQTAVDTFRSTGTPEGDQWAQTIENIRKHNGVPSATEVVSQTLIFNIFCGFVIGFVEAVTVKVRYSSQPRRERLLKRLYPDS